MAKDLTVFIHIIVSTSILVSYFVALIVIANFIDKEFTNIDRILEKINEIKTEKDNTYEKTKSDKLKQVKLKLINYGMFTLLVLDLVSIIFYHNSVIIEFFYTIIKYILKQTP